MDVLYAESRNEPSVEENKMKPKEIPLLASVLWELRELSDGWEQVVVLTFKSP